MLESYEFLKIADILITNGYKPTTAKPNLSSLENCTISILGEFIDLYVYKQNFAEVVIHGECDPEGEYRILTYER